MSEKVQNRRLGSSLGLQAQMPGGSFSTKKDILSPSKHSETTNQGSMLDRSLQMRITDERLAKLERMY